MTDQLDAPDVQQWLHDTLLDAPPELDLDAVVRDGRRRRRRAGISLAVGAAAAVAAVGVLVPVVVSSLSSQAAPSVSGVTSPGLSSPTAGPTTLATLRQCSVRDLAVRVGRTDGTAGTSYHNLVITNVKSTPCRMGQSMLLEWSGGDVGARPVQRAAPWDLPPMRMLPQGTVRLTVAVPDPANFGRDCHAVNPTRLTVSFPSSTSSFDWHAPICSSGSGRPAAQGFHQG